MHYRRHMTMTGGLYPGESPAKYVALCHHADPKIARAGFVALAAFVDNPMPSNVYDPAACVATRCPAATRCPGRSCRTSSARSCQSCRQLSCCTRCLAGAPHDSDAASAVFRAAWAVHTPRVLAAYGSE